MRRLALLFAGCAVWLFLLALPALADGGPHNMTSNSGTGGLNADTCASCHRAHTANSEMLLNANSADSTISEFCVSCHGASGQGATTNVASGVQYRPTTTNPTAPGRGAILGALRNGGFQLARIDTGGAVSVAYQGSRGTSWASKVPVLSAGEPVTSAHLAILSNGIAATGKIWGNGAVSATAIAGPTVDLECTSCHNPHGNGQFRILEPKPAFSANAGNLLSGAFTGITSISYATANSGPTAVAAGSDPVTANGGVVTDDTTNVGVTRNYTVIQTDASGNRLLTAAGVATAQDGSSGAITDTSGDYFHRYVPYNNTIGTGAVNPLPATAPLNWDGPNGVLTGRGTATSSSTVNGVADPASFNYQINLWCSTCHSRYDTRNTTYGSGLHSYDTSSGDAIFRYRHSNVNDKPCTTCHVAHGSNAQMNGANVIAETMPGGTAAATYAPGSVPNPTGTTAIADSRLLKVDNRGTCQLCHDPTGSATANRPTGALTPPVP